MAPTGGIDSRASDVVTTSDRTLVRRVSDGDGAAFEELYRRHRATVLMHARKLCANRELAEEVAQETFISLWRSARCYRPGLGSVGVWLTSIARNRAIDAWRRTTVRPVEVPAAEDGPGQLRTAIGADTPAPERAVVLSLIAELPGPQKEAVFLAYFGGMTHEEIAEWSDAPLGTIKGRIRMGLRKIRRGLEEQSGAGAPVAELDAARRRRAATAAPDAPRIARAPAA